MQDKPTITGLTEHEAMVLMDVYFWSFVTGHHPPAEATIASSRERKQALVALERKGLILRKKEVGQKRVYFMPSGRDKLTVLCDFIKANPITY